MENLISLTTETIMFWLLVASYLIVAVFVYFDIKEKFTDNGYLTGKDIVLLLCIFICSPFVIIAAILLGSIYFAFEGCSFLSNLLDRPVIGKAKKGLR